MTWFIRLRKLDNLKPTNRIILTPSFSMLSEVTRTTPSRFSNVLCCRNCALHLYTILSFPMPFLYTLCVTNILFLYIPFYVTLTALSLYIPSSGAPTGHCPFYTILFFPNYPLSSHNILCCPNFPLSSYTILCCPNALFLYIPSYVAPTTIIYLPLLLRQLPTFYIPAIIPSTTLSLI